MGNSTGCKTTLNFLSFQRAESGLSAFDAAHWKRAGTRHEHARPPVQSDCIVVGGGLIGLFCARELARGGLRALLLERGQLGREASWAGAGVLAALEPRTTPAALQALLSYSQERYADLACDLQAETGIDPEWERSGLLLVGPDAVAQAIQRGVEYPASRH